MQMQNQVSFLSAGMQFALVAATGFYGHTIAPGRTQLISHWDIQSTAAAGHDPITLSLSNTSVSSWYHVDTSRCTLMGCLLEAGVYNESQLFYSDNLKQFHLDELSVPWLYRHEFLLSSIKGQHYFLETNGITSKADLFLNGQQIAGKATQAGAYAGHRYDITGMVLEQNALVVQVYPTDYNYDFALGFVDWNPYPPDNGTGVWRDIFLTQTGPVALSPLRVITDPSFPLSKSNASATVTLRATARNLEDRDVVVKTQSIIERIGGSKPLKETQTLALKPLESVEVSLTTYVHDAAIWWPRAWGRQPLYHAQLSISVDGTISDSASTTFGIRKVTSELNRFNDTIFRVNDHPFQVLGGGYSADMFLRWDSAKFITQAQYMLDLGHNTVRLEGKNEHPELYSIADRMGLMVLPGWECCDKWEAWQYNEDLSVKDEWVDSDYGIADASMRHEVALLQSHPSVLAYLIGSDYWPDDRATSIYLQAFKDFDWQNPIIASASKRGYPAQLGPSGMKMAGPYDWVPPNYWYDVSSTEDHLGAAFGFGSELGAGVGTPEVSSLQKFLSPEDMSDLWQVPEKGLYHMSTNVSSFYDRRIYNKALWERLGAPQSLDDYLLKAQILDYEATRAQFEGFSAYWHAERPATGMIYWMLNNAWPSLHWNLFDYYLHPAGSYFGAKTGSRLEHLAFDYVHKSVYLINHSIDRVGARTATTEAIDLNGQIINSTTLHVQTQPNTSKIVHNLTDLEYPTEVIFVRLLLKDDKNFILSRNVYWLTETIDTLDWKNSDWFYTPVTEYSDYKALVGLQEAKIVVSAAMSHGTGSIKVVIDNKSDKVAFFISLNLVDDTGGDVVPVFWSDNYVTLWPQEKLKLEARSSEYKAKAIQIKGYNVAKFNIDVAY